jgi:hypothetical protein
MLALMSANWVQICADNLAAFAAAWLGVLSMALACLSSYDRYLREKRELIEVAQPVGRTGRVRVGHRS